MKGFEAIPELIRAIGSPAVFAVLASTNGPYLAHGSSSGAFPLIRTRHEETATAAAAAYSRVSGLVGITSVQRGPGIANSINALMVAKSVHSPLVVLVAESPATKEKTAKNVNQRALVESIGVGFHHANLPSDLEREFMSAVGAAEWSGIPQVLSIADGILEADTSLVGMNPISPDTAQPDPQSIASAIDTIEGSRRPLIIAGHGAIHSEARSALEMLADLIGARLGNSLYGSGFFAGHPRDLGLCGTWASRVVQQDVAACDVVLGFGASLNRHTSGEGLLFAGSHVIHCEIDLDQPSRASSPELALLGDARLTAVALIEEWERRQNSRRPLVGDVPTSEDIRRSVLDVDLGHDPSRGPDIREAYDFFDSCLPEDRIVVTDSGRHLPPMLSLVRVTGSRGIVHSRGYGSVGLGIGAAIGAATARPDRPVTLFCGDGGFTMASQELDTIRRYELNIKIVVMNDLMYGAEVRYLRGFGLGPEVLEMSFPDVALLARTYGGAGVCVRSLEELHAIDLSGRGLQVIDVRIDPDIQGSDALG